MATRNTWRRCPGYDMLGLMDSLAASAAPMPIGERIAALLKEQDKTAAWLADTAGMHRSTVHRLLTNKRKSPTPQTLAELAPVLGMTIEQLVAGTDAAARVGEAASLVPRAQFEAVVQKMLECKRRVMDAKDRARRAEEEAAREYERRIRDQAARELAERDKAKVAEADERELDDLRTIVQRREQDLERYKSLFARVVADNEVLKAQIAELGQAINDSRRTTSIASILAGAAATALVHRS